ncbi:hypothetical protein J27TS7_33890 [Paenibacillus dendritiformis]|uniref:hypothetical protein n=1 Tax=Paenibacillus dendritiformis TaxID=130049 RepID=UPI001B1F7BDE|nr:hypothetical protein [Paenibacillus dendritiformis]GIO73875.1 hypothetical protein J27TS7_33890 [Paenibacillus dendritiformis]
MNKNRTIAALLSLSLALGTFSVIAPDTHAAAAKTATNKSQQSKATANKKAAAVYTLDKLSPVKVTAKSSVKLTDVNLYKQEDANILTYTITYTNNEARSIPLIDYWTKVRTKSNTVYPTNLTTKDQGKKTIPAQSSLTLTYYAKVAKHLTANDLIFDVIKWDFSQPNFEKKLGSFQIPANYVTATQTGKDKSIRMNDIPIKTSVSRVNIFPSDDYHYVNVAVNVENAGFKMLENPAYKYVVKTANGNSYPLVPDNSSKEYKLQPGEKKTLNFMTMIPNKVKVDKLEMQVLEEDETAKITLPVGTFVLPKSTTNSSSVKAHDEKVITIGESKVRTKIASAWTNQSYDKNDVSVTFMFENLSNREVTVPKYEFEMRGPKGFSVPIVTKSMENMVLKPMEKRPITLTAVVSTEIGTEELKLHMNRPSDPEQKNVEFKYPEGIYALPELQTMQNKIGTEYNVQHSKGTLGVSIDSLQRLPWTDGDIVSAKMKIRNKEFKTIQLPALEGVFKLDSADISGKTQVVSSNGTLIIGPKEEVDVYVVTKIPSYLDFTQIQIALLEKIGETDAAQLIQFTNIGSLAELPVVEYGTYHNLMTQGRKADIMARNSKVYKGNVEQVVYTDLVMKSLEERQTTLSQLVGYYRTKDGRYYKANITQVEGPTSPDGRNIVTVWAKMPNSIDAKEMQLVIGEGITENKLTPPKGESDGYVNAVAMNLDMQQPSFKKDFNKLDMFPYTLTISNFYATANKSPNLSVEFTYDLTREEQYNMGEYGHKLVLEITDTSGRKAETTLEFNKDLHEGKNKSFSTSLTDAFFEQVENGAFQVSLYDFFQGERIKLASYSSRYNIKNFRE